MNPKIIRALLAVAALAFAALTQQSGFDLGAFTGSSPSSSLPHASSAPLRESGRRADASLARIEDAVANRTSGFMVTVDARVEKTLRDDTNGSQHQRFLIELANGRVLLVAHNIDLADRIDLREGDRVRVHGQYEWNEKGGVLHWTHHDPRGRHEGGWIEHDGLRVE